jgi:hypothetical protein
LDATALHADDANCASMISHWFDTDDFPDKVIEAWAQPTQITSSQIEIKKELRICTKPTRR